MKHDDIPLKILVCDPEKGSQGVLCNAIASKEQVLKAEVADSVDAALTALRADNYNTVFIDPVALGLEASSGFVFRIREEIPEIVFVLYVDRSRVERQSAEFYRGKRSRFGHYYSLDKRTPAALFADELDVVLRDCQLYLSDSTSQANLSRLVEETKHASGAKDKAAHAQLVKEIREALSVVQQRPSQQEMQKPKDKSVFLSHRFAEEEYVNGLRKLLEQNGFGIVTGKAANTYISKAVLDRIKSCEFFLCLMTRHEQKSDGTYTTSPWLLEEKGAALAFGKRIVLMVEEGVVDVGGLQGDWQRIHFGPKGFLNAALEAVEQLKSYVGGE